MVHGDGLGWGGPGSVGVGPDELRLGPPTWPCRIIVRRFPQAYGSRFGSCGRRPDASSSIGPAQRRRAQPCALVQSHCSCDSDGAWVLWRPVGRPTGHIPLGKCGHCVGVGAPSGTFPQRCGNGGRGGGFGSVAVREYRGQCVHGACIGVVPGSQPRVPSPPLVLPRPLSFPRGGVGDRHLVNPKGPSHRPRVLSRAFCGKW